MDNHEWWERLDARQKEILAFLAMVPHPLPLDALIAASGWKAVDILQILEEITELDFLLSNASSRKGFYALSDGGIARFILEQMPRKDLEAGARKLIDYYEGEGAEGEGRCLTLAHLHRTAAVAPVRLDYFLAAAVYCQKKEMHAEALSYYRAILEREAGRMESLAEKQLYIEASVGVTAAYGHMLFLPEQRAFLEKARLFAEEIHDRGQLLTVQLALGKTLEKEGFYDKAARHLEQAWENAQTLGEEKLLKKAALMTSDFLFRQGLVAEAVRRYEEVIGDLEDFSLDEATLRGCTTLGWCYGVCGQTSRGLGLIEMVRIKAKEHRLTDIGIFADLMMVFTLLEARRISEAQVYLDKILSLPEGVAGPSILWATHWCVGYVAFCRGDLEACLREHIRGCQLLKQYGRPHHRGGWVMEYLEGLDIAGLANPEMSLTSELERLAEWPDIFMRGVAHRFKGQRGERTSQPADRVKADYEKSLELLQRSGARLELARTQIALARVLIGEGATERARRLLEEAWEAMARSNIALFPEDLKRHLEEKTHEELLVNTIVEITNVLGTVRDKKRLLQIVIQLTMRFTFAERGGFFLNGEDGRLELVASRNLDLPMLQSDRFRPYLQEIEEVARTGKEVVKKTVGSEESSLPQALRVNWMICCPVILQDRVLGALYLAAKVTPESLKNDLPLLRAISTQMAVALDNVQAYEKIAALKDRLEEETRYYRMDSEVSPQLKSMVGCSKAIGLVQQQMQKVAPMDSTVLITGETGVGKELVARGIHRLSKRSSGAFIVVNVASLSEGLIESELFGHEKGAFTGALRSRLGRFELAQGGTLFLDDIQNLSLDIQAKLLRVLEGKEFERVGGSSLLKADFRLIAATNRPLHALVAEGGFRSDLYYRLNVFPIQVPPLRERREDIPLLVLHFLEMYKKGLGKDIRGVSKGRMKDLTDYPWPGNVRELRHVIERAVILSEGSSLMLPSFQAPADEEGGLPGSMTLEEMERAYIIKALERCSWKVGGEGGAACQLGLKPTTLHSKMKKLGIRKKITPA
ncbi:sigma-54-dependent Fis family transcriptional regulator [Desulfatiglans anilini]|uniref:sigma-54-dependent Fis family transcriptional regulator n=1 Tax=Desulfatiglans anilini TaxID=90728 RepID=UPI000413C160|nr:sigma-54-dependent Fis family transcriptional regulator [Desulfatiglans anilini]